MPGDVVVVVGVGGMGRAIATRIGGGRTVLVADRDESMVSEVAESVRADGFDVVPAVVDVSSVEPIEELADAAARLGNVINVVHTAGISPTQGTPSDHVLVNLRGVVASLHAFGEVIAPNGAGVYISSMAGHVAPQLTRDQEFALATAPGAALGDLDFVRDLCVDSVEAYRVAKRANHLRVRSASLRWGERSGRVNSISPGIISTTMGRAELMGRSGSYMEAPIAGSPVHRRGTACGDIAAAAAFLLGHDALFITGTDLLVDGGVTAAQWCGALLSPAAAAGVVAVE